MDPLQTAGFPKRARFSPPYPMSACETELKALYLPCAAELRFDPYTADAEQFTRLRTRMLPEIDRIMEKYAIAWHRHPAYNSEQLLHMLTLDFAPGLPHLARYIPMPWHTNGYFEILCCTSGPAVYYIGDRTVPLTAGDVLILPPGVRFAFLCPGNEAGVSSNSLRASTLRYALYSYLGREEPLPQFLAQTQRAEIPIAYFRISTGSPTLLNDFIAHCVRLAAEHHPTMQAQMNAALLQFLCTLELDYSDRFDTVTAQTSENIGDRMLTYIRTHFHELTRADLARQFNYSERQVTRILQERTGMSFARFLSQTRMEYIANTLTTTDKPVRDIVEASGYVYCSHFYELFHERFGMSPSDYRTQLSC